MIIVIQKASNNRLRIEEDYAIHKRYDDIERAVRDIAASNPAIVFYKNRRKSGSVLFIWTGKNLLEIGYASRPAIAEAIVQTMRFTEATEYALDKIFKITSITNKLVKETLEKTMQEVAPDDLVISEQDANKVSYAMGYVDALRDFLLKLRAASDRFNLRGDLDDGDNTT